MARPRKSRLVPSLATFAEELVRVLTTHVDRTVADARRSLEGELHRLRRDLSRLLASDAAGAHGAARRSTRSCSVAGCQRPHVARAFCKNHYQQARYRERRS